MDFTIELRFSDDEFFVFWFGTGVVSATSLLFLFSCFFLGRRWFLLLLRLWLLLLLKLLLGLGLLLL
jgi:hypothetical protein